MMRMSFWDRLRSCTYNALIHRLRRKLYTEVVVAERTSVISGLIEVVELGPERQIRCSGHTQSYILKRGGWREVHRECWGHFSRSPYSLVANPRVLMCGLGGGTALHLLSRDIQPSAITVLEMDPDIIDLAKQFFAIDEIPNTEIIVGDATEQVEVLKAESDAFDLIVDDALYEGRKVPRDMEDRWVNNLLAILGPKGVLVFNRAIDGPEDLPFVAGFMDRLRDRGLEVSREVIRQRWCNDIIYCRKKV